MKVISKNNSIYAPPYVSILLFIIAILSLFFAVIGLTIKWHLALIIFMVFFGLLCFMGALENYINRVVLNMHYLEVKTLWRTEQIPKHSIKEAIWDSRTGVSIQLKSDKWKHIPEVTDAERLTRAINIWIEQTDEV